MKGIQTSIERIAERFGLIASLALIGFFLLMKVAQVAHFVELRVLNFFIIGAAIIRAEKHLKKHKPEVFTYFKGIALAMLTGVIASIVFGLFMFVYLEFIDTDFMQMIIDNQPMGRFLNPYVLSVTIVAEGTASSLIISFVTMNYFETIDDN